jgi:hypothetical protein
LKHDRRGWAQSAAWENSRSSFGQAAFLRRLVIAQAQEHGLAQLSIRRPFFEGDLCDELWGKMSQSGFARWVGQ